MSVTAAVIVRGGKVLVAQRPLEGRHPGRWEFPGGKREPGETLEECLQREMLEEMGVRVNVGERLTAVSHAYPDLLVELTAFRCEIAGGEPADIGCASHRWVSPGELEGVDLLPPDRRIARALFPKKEGSAAL